MTLARNFLKGPRAIVEAWIVDFSYINMIVQMKGEAFCDGVFGADILSRKSAVIDYKCKKLYLKGE